PSPPGGEVPGVREPAEGSPEGIAKRQAMWLPLAPAPASAFSAPPTPFHAPCPTPASPPRSPRPIPPAGRYRAAGHRRRRPPARRAPPAPTPARPPARAPAPPPRPAPRSAPPP